MSWWVPIVAAGINYLGDRESTRRNGQIRPLTPGEAWGQKAFQDTYNNSATRNYLGSGMDQMLRGINAPDGPMASTPTFRSSYMSGQSMAPGPRIDFSQMPAPPFRTGPDANPQPGQSTQRPPGGGGGGGMAGGAGGRARGPMNRDFDLGDGVGGGRGGHVFSDELPYGGRQGESIYDYLSRDPGGHVGANLPGGGAGTQGPPPGMEYGDGAGLRKLWDRIGPVVTQVGITAAAAMFGMSPQMIQALLDRFGGSGDPQQGVGGGAGAGLGGGAGIGGNR